MTFGAGALVFLAAAVALTGLGMLLVAALHEHRFERAGAVVCGVGLVAVVGGFAIVEDVSAGDAAGALAVMAAAGVVALVARLWRA